MVTLDQSHYTDQVLEQFGEDVDFDEKAYRCKWLLIVSFRCYKTRYSIR
ncbi:hypothetical protein PR048_015586, partial [Dryococelus australis]